MTIALKFQPEARAAARQVVQLPPLFVSFNSTAPRINPSYESVRPDAESTIAKFCQFGPQIVRALKRCNFTYLAAVFAPKAPADKFRTIVDYLNWVFIFDDQFDDGELHNDPEAAQKVVDSLLDVMEDTCRREYSGKRSALVRWHDRIWYSIVKGAWKDTQRRYKRAVEDSCAGALNQVKTSADRKYLDLNGEIAARTETIGVTPIYALIEYIYDLRLPDEVLEHPQVREFERLGSDFIIIHNDTLSYRKEENEEVPHNIVAACRLTGMTAQEALDHIGVMLDERYQAWDDAKRSLPRWGEGLDEQVQRYVDGIEDMVRANLHWMFKTKRYFGENGEEVKRHGLIDVLENPAYLQHARGHIRARAVSSQCD